MNTDICRDEAALGFNGSPVAPEGIEQEFNSGHRFFYRSITPGSKSSRQRRGLKTNRRKKSASWQLEF